MIISVFITNSNTKPILARQFTGISRPEVESLLTTFSSLHTPSSSGSAGTSLSNVKGSSHQSYFEVNDYRFVFLRCEEVYVGLISDKHSNIIEDLDTLQLLTSVLRDTIEKVTAENVIQYSFEILFAFDEVISSGYKESLTLDQVRTILEMESHDENLHNVIRQSRIDDAIKEGQKVAKELDAKRREYKRRGLNPDAVLTGLSSKDAAGGLGLSSSFDGNSSFGSDDLVSQRMGSIRKEESSPLPTTKPTTTSKKPAIKPSVLSLKKKAPTNTLVQQLAETGELGSDVESENSPVQAGPSGLNQKPIHVAITESVSGELNAEGGVKKLEITGEMFVTITDENKTSVELVVNPERNTEFSCKTHPNIDKQRFASESIIALKKGKSQFPTNLALKILTWRYKGSDESLLPISISCWTSESSKGMSVTVEYEHLNESIPLENVVIRIPIPSGSTPNVTSTENGSAFSTHTFNSSTRHLEWSIDRIGSGNTDGNMEFEVKGTKNKDALFPLQIEFTSSRTISGIEVSEVKSIDSDQEHDFSKETTLSTAELIMG